MKIRRITHDDVHAARSLRLAALADAPDAFLRSLAEEEAQPERFWRERVASNAAGVDTVGFFAVVDGVERGLVVGVYRENEPADLVSMWVVPEARRRGAARALVEAVCDWARERGCDAVALAVAPGNEAAHRLYVSCGFVPTGVHPIDGRCDVGMVRALSPLIETPRSYGAGWQAPPSQ